MHPHRILPDPFSRFLVLVLVAAVAVAGAAVAQEEPGAGADRPLFVDRVDVDIVNVEVFVTDARDRRVTGLEMDDFEVLVDGEPVELSNFFSVSQPDRVAAELAREQATAEGHAVTPASELPEEQQLNLVVYVDHFNIAPQNRKRALEELEGFLEDRMFQGDRVMLMGYDGQLEVAQSFTRDWNRVREGLRRLGEGKAMRLQQDAERGQALRLIRLAQEEDEPLMAQQTVRSYVQQQKHELRRSLNALERTLRSMSGLPGRKAVLYVSDGLPRRVGEELYQYMAEVFSDDIIRGGELTAGASFVDTTVESLNEDQGQLFDRITREANAQGVTLYTVEARGGAGQAGISAEVDSTLVTGGGRVALEASRTLNYQEPLIDMAVATGGAAILNTYELSEAFYRTGADFDHFYSLGFRAPGEGEGEGEGEYQEITVRVKDRPGLRVRHRKGFADKPPEQRMADRTLSSLVFDMQSNPLGVEMDFGVPERQGRKEFHLPLLVRIPIDNVTLLPNGKVQEGRLRIYLAVEDEQGAVSDVAEFTYPVQVPREKMSEARGKEVGFARMLAVRPGTPQVVIGVWDELSGTESFVTKAVEVKGGKG